MPTSASVVARKRYYLVQENRADTASGYSFTNEDQALVNGRLAGTHEHRVPGFAHPRLLGIPHLRAKPKLVILGAARNARDYYATGPGPVFVSTRAKKLLEQVDPDAFEFAECEAVTRRKDRIEPYWWMAVIRMVETFDEERSKFVWYRDAFPSDPNAQANPTMVRLYDIHMPRGFSEEYHAFWLGHYQLQAVFDDVLVDAWRKAGLTGALFTPLQPPAQAEFKDHNWFVNYPYWTEWRASRGDGPA